MSKIKAFVCDYKNHIVEEDEIVGVLSETSLFTDKELYRTIMNPDKSQIHVCMDCYRAVVLVPAQNMVNRKREGEEPYKLKIKELTHGFLSMAVKNYRLSQK